MIEWKRILAFHIFFLEKILSRAQHVEISFFQIFFDMHFLASSSKFSLKFFCRVIDSFQYFEMRTLQKV